ncbi:MAG: GNAT family N-acetyltransferase [Bacteroidia bacterium]
MKDITIIKAESDADFDRVFAIRDTIFAHELGITPEEEFDGLDHLSHHYLAIIDGIAVGTSRWRQGPQVPVVRLERFAVLSDYRDQKVGSALFEAMMKDVPSTFPIEVYALVQTVPFFQKMGLQEEGEVFEVAGLKHQAMVR